MSLLALNSIYLNDDDSREYAKMDFGLELDVKLILENKRCVENYEFREKYIKEAKEELLQRIKY